MNRRSAPKTARPPDAPDELDRRLAGVRLEVWLYAALLGAAFVLRLLWMGYRPLHHDESIHAYYSWRIWTSGISDYRYDPVYHGPVLYYATAVLQWLFGPSDASSRLLAVLSGLGLVALAWPLRPLIGRREALGYAVLVTISPTLAYYGRSLRHDVPIAFLTLAGLVAFLHFVRTGRQRLAYAAGVCAGLAAATKEDIYLTALTFFLALLASGVIATGDRRGRIVERATGWVKEIGGFLAARWMPIAGAVLVALALALVFYTSLLTHRENWNFVSRALRYWWGQHSIQRIGGPWWYYLPLEVAYEPLIFFPALGMLWRWRRGTETREQAVFLVWAVVGFGLYAWAQEKVPWLLVPFLVPQAVLAGAFLASLRPRTLAMLLPLVAFTLWSLVASSYLYDAPRTEEPPERTHNEPMVYVQSTYDVPNVLREIEEVARKLGTGKRTKLVVVGDATWPLSWYLRDYAVHWTTIPAETSAPIVVVDPADAARIEKDLAGRYRARRFAVRGWWQIDWSRASVSNVVRFLLLRLAWSDTGTTDAVMLVATDLDPARPRPSVRLRPAPPQRSYFGTPTPMRVARSIGGPGTGPGQLGEPRAIAFDATGDLIVAETSNHRIQKLDPSGRSLAVWGGPAPGDGPGQFRSPNGVAVGEDGSIYVADTWNHRIQKLDRDGRFVAEWREQNPGFWGPRAIAVAPGGRVFVADTGNKRILAFDENGTRLVAFGGDGSDDLQFIEPVGLAVDPDGKRLYVADTGNRRVQVIELDGGFDRKWTVYGWQEFYTEPHLAWEPGTLWATDSFNRRVNAYDPATGFLKRSFGGGPLSRPVGVAVSPGGEVWVSDVTTHRLSVLAEASEPPRPAETLP